MNRLTRFAYGVVLAAGFLVCAEACGGGYVSDGLISRWDGFLNSTNALGVPVHDTTVDRWVDLVGGRDLVRETGSSYSFGENYLRLNTTASSSDKTAFSCTHPEMALAYTNRAFTLEFHCANAGYFNGGVTVALGYSSGASMRTLIIYDWGGKIYDGIMFWATSGSSSTVANPGLNTRHTVTITAEGTTYRFYIDGVKKFERKDVTQTKLNDGVFTLGGGHMGWGTSPQSFYSVRAYNRVLSAEDMATNRTMDQMRFGPGSLEVTGDPVEDAETAPSSGYGTVTSAMGDEVEITAPASATSANGITNYTLTGWTTYTNDETSAWIVMDEGSSDTCSFTHPGGMVRLTWHWALSYNPGVSAPRVAAVSDYAARLAGDVLGLGESGAGTVKLAWGWRPDALLYTNAVADVSARGPVETTLDGLLPGRTYFARFLLEENGTLLTASATIAFATTGTDARLAGINLLKNGTFDDPGTSCGTANSGNYGWPGCTGFACSNWTFAGSSAGLTKASGTWVAKDLRLRDSVLAGYIQKTGTIRQDVTVTAPGRYSLRGYMTGRPGYFADSTNIASVAHGGVTNLVVWKGNDQATTYAPFAGTFTATDPGVHTVLFQLGRKDSKADRAMTIDDLSFAPEDGGYLRVTERNEAGALAAFDVAFEATSAAGSLYALYDDEDRGWGAAAKASWARCVKVADVPAGATAASAAPDAAWGTAGSRLTRFVLETEDGAAAWSGALHAHAAADPRVTLEVADGTGGDTLVLKGTLVNAGTADCTLTAYTGPDAEHLTNAWTSLADGVRTTAGDFTLTLCESDPSSARWIAPGRTTVVVVEATSGGRTSRSAPLAVTPRAEGALGTTGATVSRRTVTFSVHLQDPGARGTAELSLWGGDTNDPAAMTRLENPVTVSDGFSITNVTHVYPAFETDYYWQFRLATVTAGGTTNWTVASPVKSVHTADTTTYTWKRSVTAGNWNDPANWANNQGDDCLGYPYAAGASVTFLPDTAAAITVNETVSLASLAFTALNLNLSFVNAAGTTNENTVTAAACAFSGSGAANAGTGGRISFDRIKFRAPVNVGVPAGRTYVFTGCDVYFAALTCANTGRMELRDGTTASVSVLYVGGGGGRTALSDTAGLVIDDSALTLRESAYVGYSSVRGRILFEGAAPQLYLSYKSGVFRSDLANADTRLEFLVPAGGYAAAPIRAISSVTALFAASGKSALPVYVLPESPAYRADATVDVPLVAWAKGIDRTLVSLADLPGASDKFLYGTSWTNDYGWTDAALFEGTAKALGVRLTGSSAGYREEPDGSWSVRVALGTDDPDAKVSTNGTDWVSSCSFWAREGTTVTVWTKAPEGKFASGWDGAPAGATMDGDALVFAAGTPVTLSPQFASEPVAKYWKGAAGGDFHLASNWRDAEGVTCAEAPGPADLAVIDAAAGATFSVRSQRDIRVRELKIGHFGEGTGGTSTLELFGAGTNVVSGALSLGAGAGLRNTNALLRVDGDAALSGNAAWTADRPVHVKGNVTLADTAKITHTGPQMTPDWRVDLAVDGDMTVGLTAKVTADSLGYGVFSNVGYGPGASFLPAHGGMCTYWNWAGSTPCYGSLTRPTELGACNTSGGRSGGGAIRLTVGGRLTVEGDVTACGTSSAGYYTGAGGSVWIDCGTLAGGGAVKANGGNGPSGILGAGGRLALYQRTAADWSAFEGLVQAYGGSTGTSYSGPGTVYKVTAGEADDEGVLEIRSPAPSYNGVVQVNTQVTDTRIGTLDLPAGETLRILSGGTLTVTRDWINRGTFTADDGSTVIFAGTNTAHVFGKNTFSALVCEEPGKRFVFAGGKTNWCDVAANGRLTLHGTAEKPVALLTEPGDATIRMTIGAGVKQGVTHAALSNVVSSAGAQGVAYDSTDWGGNSNWLFTASVVPGTTNTWTGAASDAWFDAGNWSLGRVPVETDVARIAAAGTPPVLKYDLEINSIAIDAGATLTVSGAKVTVTNRLDATGTLAFAGTETLTLAGDARFAGADSFRGNGTLLVSGARPHRFEGRGTAFYVVTVGAGSGDVTFAGGFSALTLTVAQGASARTLSFEAGKAFALEELYAYGIVDGEPALTLTGTGGGAWSLAVAAFAKLEGICASNCNASAGTTLYADRPSEDLGGNANWVFNGETAEWTGGAGTTVFGTAANWSTFAVPGKNTRVVIAPSAASTVEMKADAKVGELCLDGGKGTLTFKTGNYRLDVTGSLTVKRGATAYLDKPCSVGGDLYVRAGGKVTHNGGSQTAWVEPYKIDVTVGGDVQVDADGAINASATGYASQRGPGYANWTSHGGRMYDNLYWGNGTACYGSITCPTNYGSSNSQIGGGAIKVTATGDMRVNGKIIAQGGASASHYSGAGGSVWLTCATLTGAGEISANGGDGTPSVAGGGRVAVYQRVGESIGTFAGVISAYGGRHPTTRVPQTGCGTLYFVSAGQADDEGELVLRNEGSTEGYTEISANVLGLEVGTIAISNECTLRVVGGKTMTLKGSFLNRGRLQSQDDSAFIFTGTDTAQLAGDNGFYSFTCETPGKMFLFGTNANERIRIATNGFFTVRGTEAAPISLLPDGDGSGEWRLEFFEGVSSQPYYLAVSNSNAGASVKPVTTYGSLDCGGNANWIFQEIIRPGAIVTWVGTNSADWADLKNWNPARELLETDEAVVPGGCPFSPVISAGSPVMCRLRVKDGGLLTVRGTDLTVTNDFSVADTARVVFAGTETFSVGGNVSLAAAGSVDFARTDFILNGPDDQTADLKGASVFHLTIDKRTGDVSFADGFSADQFTVEAADAARTVTFRQGTRATVREFNAFGLVDGEAGLTLASSEAGTAWQLALTGFMFAEGLRVRDSDASPGRTASADAPSDDLTGNTNWDFGTETATWTGGAGDSKFASAKNWSTGVAPGETTRVRITSAATISLAKATRIGSLTLGGRGAKVTFTAGYPLDIAGHLVVDQGATAYLDKPCTVGGDVFVRAGGTVKHNGGSLTAWSEPTKIDLTAGGAVQVDADGAINASQCGYGSDKGAGYASWASHGGRMYSGKYWGSATECYGSITCPTNYGTGGHGGSGGGAIKVTATGDLRVNGKIIAQGWASASHYSATGGSVWLTCGTLTGTGEISANGGDGTPCTGAGGRVAVYQRVGESIGTFSGVISAYGGRHPTTRVPQTGCGTLYFVSAGQADDEGELVLRNEGSTEGLTELSANMLDTAVGSVAISNECTLRVVGGKTLTLKGGLWNLGAITNAPGSTVVFEGAGEAYLRGTNVFDTFRCETPGKRFTFATDEASLFAIRENGYFTFNGAEGDRIVLRPDDPEAQWKMRLGANVRSDVHELDVEGSDATAGEKVQAYSSYDAGRNDNWVFRAAIVPGEEIVWVGTAGTDWSDVRNWDRERVPVETDTVVIRTGTHAAALTSDGPRVNALRVESGSLTVRGTTLTVTNGCTVAAGGALELANAVFAVSNALSVAGALRATGGGVTVVCGGNLGLAAGETFACGTSLVRLVGGANQTVTPGWQTFYRVEIAKTGGSLTWQEGFSADVFRADATEATDLLFASGVSVTLNELYLSGAVGDAARLGWRCSAAEGSWLLAVKRLHRIAGVRVGGCDASGGIALYADDPSENLDGNRNWTFGAVTAEWTGGAETTSFGDAENWSTHRVPGAGDRAVVKTGGNVMLSAAASVRELVVGGGDAVRFTAIAPLVVGASLEVSSGGTLELNVPCVVSNSVFARPGATLTHATSTDAVTNRIDLTVGGDVFLEQGAAVDLKGKGFANRSGPGYKAAGTAHAGRNAASTATCVGRVDRPVLPGSAGDGAGGGAVRIAAGGTLTLDGTVTADAADVGNGAGTSGAGGSVWLEAQLFAGAGSVSANGGAAYGGTCGGGGRIALVQETPGDLSAWRPRLTARGGKNQGGAVAAGAGTVYLKAGRFADTFVDNAGGEGVTVMPSPDDSKTAWRTARVTVTGGGDVLVGRDVKVRDLDLAAKTAKLHLDGKVLTIIELTHEDRKGWLGTVTEDGGEIRWIGDRYFRLIIR